MMDYREILRLRSLGFSQRQLEREKIVGREKSKEIFQAADRAGIHWPLDDDVTNEELELLLFPGKYSTVSMYMEPDYPYIHRELAKHGVTLTFTLPDAGRSTPNALFRGYLQTDGYSGYHGLEGVTHVGCWAHARRKLDEACRAVPKGKRSPTAEQGVAYCTQLFELEKEFKDLSPEERKKQRLKREKPVLDAMLAWANTRNAAPKSALGKALTYLKNQWPYLNNYLLDGRIELSNNRAERSIEPFVISRKNFLFANTARGAKSSAVIFSLIETAKENGLDPYRYLTWLFAEAPRLSQTDSDWASKLLPWNAPENCRPAK